MNKITKEELLKLAHLSRLQLEEHEISALMNEIEAVLSYAHRVNDIAQLEISEYLSRKNCNVVRQDSVKKTDSREILAQAPECEQNYFVVPAILETT